MKADCQLPARSGRSLTLSISQVQYTEPDICRIREPQYVLD